MREVPFSTVEDPSFRTMLSNLRPEFKQHKRVTVTKDCVRIFEKEKKSLKNLIAKSRGRVSLTTDTWTSIQTKCYMSLTAHYIDDNWRLQKKILNFIELDERHTGVILSLALGKCIADWNIEEKIFSLTLDNVSANNTVATRLREQYKASLPLDGKFFHIRCCAHILNLIVKEGLKDLDASIVKIRDAVKFVSSSPQRLKTFQDFMKKLKLGERRQILDCITRWNSTYHMLERAVTCKEAFSSFHVVENFKNPPNEEDWRIANELCKFLKVFDDSTNVFSATSTPTSNLYFYHVCMIDLHLRNECHDPIVSNMQIKMMEKFGQYWNEYSMVLSIAVVFDPRHKLDFVEFCLGKVNGVSAEIHIREVRQNLKKLFEWYRENSQQDLAQDLVQHQESHNCGSSSNIVLLDKGNLMQEYYQFKQTARRHQPSKSELEVYLDDEIHPDGEKFDILSYWSTNEQKYPILASMARDILAIPVSTVASESAFSTGSRVIDEKRSRLKPSTIEALICTKDWLREGLSYSCAINLNEFMDEDCDDDGPT